jgi:hypothetical protein
VFHTGGHHIQIARPQGHLTATQANYKGPLQNQEEVIGVWVRVPLEFTLTLTTMTSLPLYRATALGDQ